MKAYRSDHRTPVLIKPKVAVLGAGNVAMDSARTALRLGAEEVKIVYRRTENESKARDAELAHAREEGIEFMWLNNAVEVLGDDEGWVRGLRCIEMELGEPGADGRRRPLPIEGSEFEIEVGLVIVAYGNRPHPLVPSSTEGLKVGQDGTIQVTGPEGQTNLEGVFAGGDIVTGAATVIQAMGAGKDAAGAIDRYVSEKYGV
jgi:glutamate synthase (NADPH/NADH) small chain